MSAWTGTAREGKSPDGVLRTIPWASLFWFGALLLLCYAPVLSRLVRQWASDDDMGHGFFVPVVAAYIAWQRRDELLAVKPVRNWWGLAVMVWGALQLYVATLGAELFLARTAFIVSLAGLILFLRGTRTARLLAFPLFLLFFMVPIPSIIYNQVTFKFQILASRLAEGALSLLGVPVLRDGNILELANQQLNVAEACSGIRSLLTLSFLSLVYAYFFDRKVWMRAALLIATVPIAIIANAGRVTITGLLAEVNPELAEGMLHTAQGWLIFMVALFFLVAVHALINKVYRVAYERK
jgi:exosortase